MRERGDTEPRVTDADVLTFVSHHLSGDVYQGTLLLRDHLPSLFVPVHENELMDPVGCVSFPHNPLLEQAFLLNVVHNLCRQAKSGVG